MPGRLLVFLLASSFSLLAQDWRGDGRASGVVLDLGGAPVAGAAVRLSPSGTPDGGPPPVTTDAAGRWAIAGLAPGRWDLAIEAEGFLTATGWLDLAAEVAAPPLRVRLRSLAEVPPLGVENSPATVLRWLERGNSLLDQGRPVEAREEYERALPHLEAGERSEVRRAIARTHFVQGDAERAVQTLETALAESPDDGETRDLYRVLQDELGRPTAAREFLARLDRGDVAPPPPPALETLPAPAPAPERPVLPPEPGRRGPYRVTFAEASPWSAVATYRERTGFSEEEIRAGDPDGGAYDLGEETFEVFVPEEYRPEAGWGLFVWVSPTSAGGTGRPETAALLAERRLLWAGANDAGNERPAWDRAHLALDAAHNLARLYDLDAGRIYVGGYSGGGRVASALSLLYPEVFRGGLFLYGCDFFRRVEVPDKPGAYWPPRFDPPRDLERQRREGRFVLLTGELDFNRAQTLATYEAYVAEGFAGALYLDVPGASHYDYPGRDWMERALEALDGKGLGGPEARHGLSGERLAVASPR